MIRDPYHELPRRNPFPTLSSLKSNADITPEAFNRFTSWLGSNEEEAGERYTMIHARLIKFFTCRGCECPEDLADETMNRVTIKAENFAETYKGVPERYFYGVGRKVFLEYTRSRKTLSPPPIPDTPERKELELQCLEQCMQTLPRNSRQLISDYHREEKRAKINLRKELAKNLKIEFNALRIRIHRILRDLRMCVFDCIEKAEIE
jgi:DNA-directed RNA polymerase specialized sigma24 family protein